MAETPHPWDRLPKETPQSFAAFHDYIALGARRSVREAARKHHSDTTAVGEISSVEDTTVRTWMGWSAKHRWVSRAVARDEWLVQVSDEQISANLKACMLAMTTRAQDFLKSKDAGEFLKAARSLALHFPPVQRVEDVSERFEDLSDLSDEQLERMKDVRDAARRENADKAE